MISFENLFWLFLFPLAILVRELAKPYEKKQEAGLKVPFYAKLQSIKETLTLKGNAYPLYLAYFIWFLLLLAASGPQWLGKAVNLPRAGRDVLLAIDISGSMQIPDMQLNGEMADRLTTVKNVAQQFIQNRTGDRFGLILFGTRAYLQTPLTFDLATVKHMLLDATIGLAGTQTAIGDAIGMAIKHFKNYPNDKNKVLILLTDGVNNEGAVSPLEAAAVALKYGIKIYTVGLGSNQVIGSSLLGTQVLNSAEYELDEDTLKKIAQMTHGFYFRASNPQELLEVYNQLDRLEPRLGENEIFRPKTPLYYWPLGLAFFLAMSLLVNKIWPFM